MAIAVAQFNALAQRVANLEVEYLTVLQQLTGKVLTPIGTQLNTLQISTVYVQLTVPWSAAIINRTPGSTITAMSSDGTLMSVVGSTVSGVFNKLGSPNLTFTEVLAGGQPKTSVVTLAVLQPGTNSTVLGGTFDFSSVDMGGLIVALAA